MVNIKEVADYVAANNGLTKALAERAVKDAFAYIKDAVAAGTDVNLDKFGKFSPEKKAERNGRNPKTGESMVIAAKTVVKFKPAKDFKDQVSAI